MQETNHSFTELKTELLEKLRNRGCTTITITGYRYLCNSIFTWLSDNGFDCYTEKAGFLFLQHYQSEHGENQYYLSLHTVVQRSNDLLKGKWSDVHSDYAEEKTMPKFLRNPYRMPIPFIFSA